MSTSTPLKVLFIGGTGTISASSVRLAAEQGMNIFVLNRGNNTRGRDLPDSVTWLTGDITRPDSVLEAIGSLEFDSVINFLSYNSDDAARAVTLFAGRTKQYIHISTASMYHKPILQVPIVESNLRANAYLEYARKKIDAENTLMDANRESGFPVTIVRPSHTYDEASPPLAGGWTVIDRIARGAEVVVHGDGTSLWTITHAADLAVGLVGLIGNPRAIGEDFNITSSDVYVWDQIIDIVAEALGTTARIVHIPSEFFPLAAPDWGWSELMVGDLSHSAIFDTSKIRRYVPAFEPTHTFHRSVHGILEWRADHPAESAVEPAVDDVFERLVKGYHESRKLFEALAPVAVSSK